MHEIQMHEDNCFITLTYNDQNLPSDGSLDVKHFQLFMKKYRKWLAPKKIRYYHCGEYGDHTHRPHYHAIIFGHDFEDKKVHKRTNGNNVYISKTLDELWGKGFCTLGDATFESAGYVARYIMKKWTGKDADSRYVKTDPDTGEILVDLKPEYTTMSQGIGRAWLEKYKTDVYPSDEVIVNGRQTRPPKFYDRILAESEDENDQQLLRTVKAARARNNLSRKGDQTPERLEVREKVLESRFNQLKRGL